MSAKDIRIKKIKDATDEALCKTISDFGKPETLDWGFRFLTDSESNAFKIAYAHRHNPKGVKIEWLQNLGLYGITVFSADCAEGIDRS